MHDHATARYRRALIIFFAAFCLPMLAPSNLTLVILLFAAGFPFSLAYGTVGSLVSVISPEGVALVTTVPPLQRWCGLGSG